MEPVAGGGSERRRESRSVVAVRERSRLVVELFSVFTAIGDDRCTLEDCRCKSGCWNLDCRFWYGGVQVETAVWSVLSQKGIKV
ncbi:hypothetical protein RchiOBHm_Chr1g0324651 [Rosa chinensis]|uniref:Uncharacterized protein n=1 Tax=Rosa chinensis TaxID=74649 RepID=A0A2P6S9R8_ROSCH|nr:hypothetical protein RchiOBHm_Chr1g0324651 [Rosa chinensis]